MKTNAFISIEESLTKELVAVIDGRIEEILKQCDSFIDADTFGYYDSLEHVTGLGFVVCQSFITAVYGQMNLKKQIAISSGTKHRSGFTISQIVNDAANYWKHQNEWELNEDLERRLRIERAFQKIGFSIESDYPLSNILVEICLPKSASFMLIFELLLEWMEDLNLSQTCP